MAGYFDKNKDYSKELMRSDLSTSERERLTQERQNKIDAVYGGKEPTLDGSNKTYSETYGSGSSSSGSSGKNSGGSSSGSSSKSSSSSSKASGYYDPNKDYSSELMNPNLSVADRARLMQERQNKIDALYGGVEPNLDGSDKTYSEIYGNGSSNRTMPDGFQGSATGVGVWDDDQSALRDEMNRNSQLWYTADDAERERLHARNLAIAKLLNENGGDVSFDDASGTWSGSAGRKQTQGDQITVPSGGDYSYPTAPKYDNRYDEKLNEIVDEILQRDPFSYSAADDPLYKYYQGQYERNGDKAMRDTLGQVAARTGGLGSSYAGSAAQQQYNDYMQGLNDIVPELYKLAYSMYQDEADTQRANAEMLQALEAGDYAKFQDLLAQYNTDRSFNYGVFKDQRDFNYQQERDSISDARYDSEWEYKKKTDADDQLLEYAKLAKSGSSGGNKTQSSMKLSTAKDMAEQGIFSDEVLQAFYDNGYTDEYLAMTYGYEPDGGGNAPENNILTGDLGRIDYDQDEGVFTWGGIRFNSLDELASAIASVDLSDAEKASLQNYMKAYKFNVEFF